MQPTSPSPAAQIEKFWDVAFDVSKNTLDWGAEPPEGRLRRGQLANTIAAITAALDELAAQARTLGYTRVRVICEPTGGYEKRLLAVEGGHLFCRTPKLIHAAESVNPRKPSRPRGG
jgi:hypothetical protein